MSPLRPGIALALALWTIAAASPSLAWDTQVEEPDRFCPYSWGPVYIDGGWANEHTAIASETLRRLGLGEFAAGGDSESFLEIVDLNAFLFRDAGAEACGDDPRTPLEERWLPAPAHFAGLPDYSWTVYDWINKNDNGHCVGLRGSWDPFCHSFEGWLGALNSIHFGSQSRRMYGRFHSLAVTLAERAASMRARLDDSGGLPEFLDHVREAETEALVYESFAQHFFQDRWSSGHMWERWNTGEAGDLPTFEMLPNLWIGGISGIIHGAQGTTTFPDLLCSPKVENDGLSLMEWHSPNLPGLSEEYPGVGDYRMSELALNQFGSVLGIFEGYPYDVTTQITQMFECLGRGWAEVARALGSNGDGTYGSSGFVLSATAPTGDALGADCWDHWATNRWMDRAWISELLSPAEIARSALVIADQALSPSAGPILNLSRFDVQLMTAQLELTAWVDPDGTTMARGGMKDLGIFRTGDQYAESVPAYSEPVDLSTLPDVDPSIGRDKRTLFGFFHRSHADWWCEPARFADTVARLRGSGDGAGDAACVVLAERVFRATDPDTSTPENADVRLGSELPLCHHLGFDEGDGDDDDAYPYYIHRGYVAEPLALARPGGATTGPEYPESLIHWCRRLPVVDIDADDAAATARLDAEANRFVFTVTGLHFGSEAGVARIAFFEGTAGEFSVSPVVEQWSPGSITLSVAAHDVPEPGPETAVTGRVIVTTADGRRSVGRADVSFTPEDCVQFQERTFCRVRGPDPESGNSVCESYGLTCKAIAYFADDPTVICRLFHPGAPVTTDFNGTRQGVYCNGNEGLACENRFGTCHHCPACNLNLNCTHAFSTIFEEWYAECE